MQEPTRVLVVDDETLTRDVVSAMIESDHYSVHTAGNAVEALAAARAVRPHVVLLDVSLPGSDGISLCRALRDEPATASATIFMLSGRAEPDVQRSALDAGADGFLTKPYSARDLFAALERDRGPGAS